MLVMLVVWKILKADTNDDIPQLRKYSNQGVEICSWAKVVGISPDSVKENFPYREYTDSCNFWNITAIRKDLSCLDGLFKEPSSNREALSIALTSELSPKLKDYLSVYQPDSLLILVQWVEKFKNYAELDPDNNIFYESIYEYWMDKISNELSIITVKNPSIKYNFKFKYLQTRCVEQRFSPGVKKTSSEKAIENLVYNKWGHLINASWHQSTVLQKFLFFLAVIIFAIGFVHSGGRLIKLIYKYTKHE